MSKNFYVITITVLNVIFIGFVFLDSNNRVQALNETVKIQEETISNLHAEQRQLSDSLRATKRISYGDYMKMNSSERDEALETGYFDLWQDGIKAGYDFQSGVITREEALMLIPGAGSSPAVADGERGYYLGIMIACTEGYVTDECAFAAEYADTFGFMRIEL
jgi:hypothetical protein